MVKKNTILEFISTEHHNELVSIANLKGELAFLQELDEIYQDISRLFSVDYKNELHFIIGTMYLQAHNEFYIGMAQFLKSHFSKTFTSLRIAIEAGFNAYYFTKNPKDIREFLNEKSPLHRKIFFRIKEYVKQRPKEYPLAQELIATHETASNFSVHSSFKSIIYKLEHIKNSQGSEELLSLAYFDKMKHDLFPSYYFALLMYYFKVFKLFYDCFFKSEFKIEYPEREKRIGTFEKNIRAKGTQYPLKRKNYAPPIRRNLN